MRGSMFSSSRYHTAAHPNEGYFAKYPSPGIQRQCFRQILYWFHDGAVCLPFHDGVCVGANHCGMMPDPATYFFTSRLVAKLAIAGSRCGRGALVKTHA